MSRKFISFAGSAVFLLTAAGWWVLSISQDGSPPPHSGTQPAPAGRPVAARPVKTPFVNPPPSVAESPSGKISSRSKSVPSPPPAAGPAPAATVPVLTEQELHRRAARVEQEANHDLQNLVELLHLTPAQQDRIFDAMVRHSSDYLPSMTAVGVMDPASSGRVPSGQVGKPGARFDEDLRTGSSPPLIDEIAASLTPDQQIELADIELNRREWWEEIIPRLLPPDISNPSAGELPEVLAGAPPPRGGSGAAETKEGEFPSVLAE